MFILFYLNDSSCMDLQQTSKHSVCTSLQCVLKSTLNTSKDDLHGTSTLLCVLFCVKLVWYSLAGSQVCVVFHSIEEDLCQALSIIHLTCHQGNRPWGRPSECTNERKLVRCELEWGKPQQKAKKKEMTGDKQGWVREKSRGRVDNEERERRGERGDRWLLQWEWQEVDGT